MPLGVDLKLLGGSIIRNSKRCSGLQWPSRRFSKNATPSQGTVNIPSKDIVTKLPPLNQPIPNLPDVTYATPQTEEVKTKVTTLRNGLRIASEKRFGKFCTIGVVIDSGSRYEVSYPKGISHFLEKLAFGATNEYKNKEQLLKVLEKHGGICDCQSSRDTFVYAASADSRGLEAVTKILAEVVLRPRLEDNEVLLAKQTVSFELQNLLMRPEQETLLMDMIHQAAYGNSTLGLPKICPSENLEKITRDTLISYLRRHYTPTRMVVAGVGVEHEALVEYVEKYFVNTPPHWLNLPDDSKPTPDTSKAVYCGGYIVENCEVPLYPGSDLPELSHVVIGLEGCSHQDDDFIPMCVLNMMMGGGGSFSAGGPGKGMYTRLYTNVLNRHHWMFSATAYNQAYGDTGLFCVHAACPPGKVGDAVDVIIKELMAMGGNTSGNEVQRAKTQLKSMLLMNLEARPVVFEDIGRQVLATGHRKPPTYFIDGIDRVTENDIKRVAARLLASVPSVAARGKLRNLPEYNVIQNDLKPRKSRLSLFT